MAGPRRRIERVVDSLIWAANWVSSTLASDSDVQVQVDDPAGNDNAEAEPAEVWTIAGVQSRPKDGSEAAGYAKALRVQLGDTLLVIGTHDPRHVEECELGELVLHALGDDGSRRAKIVIKPDGTIDVSGTEVVIGNPDGSLEPIALGTAITNHFDSIKGDFDTHIHTTTATVGAGPTVGVISIPAPLFTNTPSTLKSTKHNVET